MGLDASTLEWIRRLPDVPDGRDVTTLRVLRRTASESGDVRLLDSLLVPLDKAERERSEIAAAERRLAHLTSQRTSEGGKQVKREREQALLRFAKTLVENERISPDAAQRRAQGTLGQLWAEQDRRADEERKNLQARLASSVR